VNARKIPAWVIDAALICLASIEAWSTLHDETPADRSTAALAVAGVGCAALALRRRYPLAVFALTLPANLLGIVAAPVIALYTLAVRSRDRRLLAACAFASAAVPAAPGPLSELADTPPTWTLVYLGYLLAIAIAPVLVGQLVQARHDLAQRLAEIEEAREHERVLHAQAVLAKERAQLAREMHDVVSHQVSLIAVQAAALQVASPDAGTQDAARTIRTLSVDTLDELRHMVTLLRASGGNSTELTPQPTLTGLRDLLASSGIETTLTGELPPTISKTAQRTIYRTVQEALTNVRKHAPGATAAVELWNHGSEFGVTITNTPATRPALSLPSSQHGLVGLAERAELLHGTVTSAPLPGGGYRITLRIPEDAG
jgi:signal transduction histidine kinase